VERCLERFFCGSIHFCSPRFANSAAERHRSTDCTCFRPSASCSTAQSGPWRLTLSVPPDGKPSGNAFSQEVQTGHSAKALKSGLHSRLMLALAVCNTVALAGCNRSSFKLQRVRHATTPAISDRRTPAPRGLAYKPDVRSSERPEFIGAGTCTG
jgi:hypothetical protein